MSQLKTIKLSTNLSSLINEAAKRIGDFYSVWQEIKELGEKEGINEKELQQIVTDRIRQELKKKGFDNRTITQKIYYLNNIEKAKEKNKKSYANKKSLINQTVEEPSHIGWDKEQALGEISDLHNKLSEANEVISKMSFNDNPNVFMINKETEFPNERYFDKISTIEACTLLKSFVTSPKQRIEIAWRVLEDE